MNLAQRRRAVRKPLSPGLPAPDAEAAAHSARVVAFVREAIGAAGGWISFADYMQHVLYAPGLGYYAAGAWKLGPAGDFTTAPEMTSLFGRTLATPIAAILKATGTDRVLELGAGSRRARARPAAGTDREPTYRILEVSADLRDRQMRALSAHGGARGVDRAASGGHRRRGRHERSARRRAAAHRRKARRRMVRARRRMGRRARPGATEVGRQAAAGGRRCACSRSRAFRPKATTQARSIPLPRRWCGRSRPAFGAALSSRSTTAFRGRSTTIRSAAKAR